MKHVILRLLAPYAAVLVFWCWLGNAWASILAYHALVLVLSRRHLRRVASGWTHRWLLPMTLPCIVVGPLMYVLLPSMSRLPIGLWLEAHALSGLGRVLMIPYFGVVHPILEQAHWSSLRTRIAAGGVAPGTGTVVPASGAVAPRLGARAAGMVAHVAFAGYHLLVLASLMRAPWLWLSFGVLVLASVVWRRLEQAADGGLAMPVLSHILVDSGLVLAAVLRAG